MMWETPYPRVVLEVRGKSGVALHYLIDVGSVADSDCPPKHYVSLLSNSTRVSYHQTNPRVTPVQLWINCSRNSDFTLGVNMIINNCDKIA